MDVRVGSVDGLVVKGHLMRVTEEGGGSQFEWESRTLHTEGTHISSLSVVLRQSRTQ